MSQEFRNLLIESKKFLMHVPAIVSYFTLTFFLAKLLIRIFDLGNATYVLTTFSPFFIKLGEAISKSNLIDAFMAWWGKHPVYVHWLIIDIFVYYYFFKAYQPKLWHQIKFNLANLKAL